MCVSRTNNSSQIQQISQMNQSQTAQVETKEINQAANQAPAVTEGLQNLVDRNYLLAVATGKSREGLDRALTKVDFGHMFSITRCGDEGFPKPNPDMLNFIMDDLGVFPDRTLMIGDTTHDLLLAHNAKTKSIGVTYGAHEKNKLAALNPLACVDSFEELMAWLLENG